MDRRQAMVRGEILPDRAHGAVLVADISGFTPLTEALVRAFGPQRGAEELTGQLDLVYQALIAHVDAFAGSVICFAGDAITCWFDRDDGRRAISAALAMQRAMAQFAALPIASGPTISIGMKIAIAVGDVRRFEVGDPTSRLLDMIAGTPLDRLAAAERLAQRGEILLDEETVVALDGSVKAAAWRTDDESGLRFARVTDLISPPAPWPWPSLPPGALAEQRVRPWVLGPVYRRLRHGQRGFLAELRTVNALFLSFGGIDFAHDEAASTKLDCFSRWVLLILDQYEGFLTHLTFGDKGSYLCGAFGAPIAHDDDARRAVMAAMELRNPPPHLSFVSPIRIGIARGLMRTGPYGGSTARTYGIVGDHANLAARLMQAAAPGGILCDAETNHAAAGRLTFEALPPIGVKGKAQPVAVYRPLEFVRPTEPARPLIGRAGERAALAARLNALVAGESSTVLVEGEPGVGKSRLLQDLIARAAELRLTAFLGRGDATERFTLYYGWREVFSTIFGISGLADPIAARGRLLERLRVLFEGQIPELAPLLNGYLPSDLPDNDATARLTSDARADNTNQLLVDILRRYSTHDEAGAPVERERPLIVVLDDVHWLDSASWNLALAVVSQIRPLLILLACRPLAEHRSADFERFLEICRPVRITLGGLGPDETRALVSDRLAIGRVPEPVAALIYRRAAGNPFFAEQLALALRDTGVITVRDGECQVADERDLTQIAFPNTVQGVVASRIDRLAPPQQLALKVASAVGQVFGFRILHDIYPIEAERPELAGNLEVLHDLDLTPIFRREPDLEYTFKHVTTQEVAYGMMLFRQRQQLHRSVADWYERTYAADLSLHYPRLADHWDRAEVHPKAIEYLGKAGEQAFRTGALRETISFFERAIEVNQAASAPEHPNHSVDAHRLAHWHAVLAQSYSGLGDMRRSNEYGAAALAVLHRPLPKAGWKMGIAIAREVATQLTHRLVPLSSRGDVTFGGDAFSEAARCYETLALGYFYTNDSAGMLYTMLVGTNLAEVNAPSPELARFYASLSLGMSLSGLRSLADSYAKRAKSVAQEVADLAARSWTYGVVGTHEAGTAQWTSARQSLETSLDAARRLGGFRLREESAFVRALIAIRAADRREEIDYAEHLFADAAGWAQERGSTQMEVNCLAGGAETRLIRGDVDGAIDLLETALPLLPKITDVHSPGLVQGLLGCALLRRGDATRAREVADLATKVSSQRRPSGFQTATGFYGIAEVSLTRWETNSGASPADVAKLRATAAAACASLVRYARVFPICKPREALYRGWLRWLEGDHKPALATWRRGLDLATQMAMPYERGLAHYELGRHLASGDPRRQHHLVQARATFEDLGAQYDAGRVDAALGV